MAKKTEGVPQDKLELYEKLVDTHPEIGRKGKTNPYTSHNGHMFSHLSKIGTLGLRLPKEEREAFMEKYNTSLYESYGTVMKEYVAVPDELLENTDELQLYLEMSYEYVKTLKPKSTGKKNSKK